MYSSINTCIYVCLVYVPHQDPHVRWTNWVLVSRRFVQMKSKALPPMIVPDDIPVALTDGNFAESGLFGVTFLRDPRANPIDGKVLAAQFGPTLCDMLLYENNRANIDKAINERIDEKFQPMDMTDEDRAELSSIAQALISDIRRNGGYLIRKICSYKLFGDYRSKKWSIARAELAINALIAEWLPGYKFSASVKLEPQPAGKPPRMIIADGDSGAIMGVLVIGCLEAWIASAHKHRTIKGENKANRMLSICQSTRRVCSRLRAPASGASRPVVGPGPRPTHPPGLPTEPVRAFMLENDGSAWDTCCSLGLRNLVENPILDAVFELLHDFVVPINHHYGARKTANTKKKYALNVQSSHVEILAGSSTAKTLSAEDQAKIVMKRRMQVFIAAIRRRCMFSVLFKVCCMYVSCVCYVCVMFVLCMCYVCCTYV